MKVDAEALLVTHVYIRDQWKLIHKLSRTLLQVLDHIETSSIAYDKLHGLSWIEQLTLCKKERIPLNGFIEIRKELDGLVVEQVEKILSHRQGQPDHLDPCLNYMIRARPEVVVVAGLVAASAHRFVLDFSDNVFNSFREGSELHNFSTEKVRARRDRTPLLNPMLDLIDKKEYCNVDALLQIEFAHAAKYQESMVDRQPVSTKEKHLDEKTPKGSIPASPKWPHWFVPNEDFTAVDWGELTFTFSERQALVVERLAIGLRPDEQAWISQPNLLDAIAEVRTVNSEKLRDIFRPGGNKHPAWMTMIVPEATPNNKNLFRIATPPSSEKD